VEFIAIGFDDGVREEALPQCAPIDRDATVDGGRETARVSVRWEHGNEAFVREEVSNCANRAHEITVSGDKERDIKNVPIGVTQHLHGDVDIGHFLTMADVRVPTLRTTDRLERKWP